MAQSKDNVLVKGFSGTIDSMLTFSQRAGKTIISKSRRLFSGQPSEKAAAVRVKFAASSAYAKLAIKDAATKALYKAAAKAGQSAYNMALADAFNAPEVESINTTGYHGAAGDQIIVRATDDFKVANVTVSILGAAGDLIEKGNAVIAENGVDWSYTATQANAAPAGSKIEAVATDLPGNSTSLSVTV